MPEDLRPLGLAMLVVGCVVYAIASHDQRGEPLVNPIERVEVRGSGNDAQVESEPGEHEPEDAGEGEIDEEARLVGGRCPPRVMRAEQARAARAGVLEPFTRSPESPARCAGANEGAKKRVGARELVPSPRGECVDRPAPKRVAERAPRAPSARRTRSECIEH